MPLRRLNVEGIQALNREKITFYLDQGLKKKFKHLAIDTGRDLSDLADEAVRDLLIKFKSSDVKDVPTAKREFKEGRQYEQFRPAR